MSQRRPGADLEAPQQELPSSEPATDGKDKLNKSVPKKSQVWWILGSTLLIILLLLASHFLFGFAKTDCWDWKKGFQCYAEKSHRWGQYSPYFNVQRTKDFKRLDKESRQPVDKQPPGCNITMVSVLSRHGARDPTENRGIAYNQTIDKVKQRLHHKGFTRSPYAFLRYFKYNLGTDQLNEFGKKQMKYSGKQFFHRYSDLVGHHLGVGGQPAPFIRAGDQDRVVESAEHWESGLRKEIEKSKPMRKRLKRMGYKKPPKRFPILTVPECESCNNTLHHSRCTAHESGHFAYMDEMAQATFASTWVPKITQRLNTDLSVDDKKYHTENLTDADSINLMQLCAFDTVSKKHPTTPSKFCYIFPKQDYENLDYYQTLNKYYSYGWGNPLGPTEGVGWANELIARLTDSPVKDHTSTNTTLDHDPETFPLPIYDRPTQIYADFTHDNDMVAALSALRLYEDTPLLRNDTRQDIKQTRGFSSAWVCPFAARVYVEKMSCPAGYYDQRDFLHHDLNKRDHQKPLILHTSHSDQDYVRVIVNDRVLPMPFCNSDKYGLCNLDDFVESQEFARSGGEWEKCFSDDSSSPDDLEGPFFLGDDPTLVVRPLD